MRKIDLSAIGGSVSSSEPKPTTTIDLTSVEYDVTEEGVAVRFLKNQSAVSILQVNFVDISYYAKQHLLKQPPLLECGVVIANGAVDKFLIPTGRTRMAGNRSIAVKYYDLTKPIKDEQVEPYERVGIRPPTGIFTYAFFEAQYLARSEDTRRGALFLIDPRMIILQYPMTDTQKNEFETFGGRKVLYFDVLGVPNLQEREEEIKRIKIRGNQQKKLHEEADRKWEEEMEERLQKKALEEAEKPKLSKKAKQKARQAAKNSNKGGTNPTKTEEDEVAAAAEAEEERLHKQKQAEVKARAEEEARREQEQEVDRKKLEAAEAKRLQEEEQAKEQAKTQRLKALLQKVESSLRPKVEGVAS